MSENARPATDRFGNPIDPIVGYARGPILASTDEEVSRMLKARRMVGERVRSHGVDGVYDLSGMNRGAGLSEAEVPLLTSHVPFFEHRLKQHQQVEIEAREICLIQHIAEIISLDSACPARKDARANNLRADPDDPPDSIDCNSACYADWRLDRRCRCDV